MATIKHVWDFTPLSSSSVAATGTISLAELVKHEIYVKYQIYPDMTVREWAGVPESFEQFVDELIASRIQSVDELLASRGQSNP